MATRIPLADIDVDETIQCRVATNAETVSDYADALRRGDEFPPVVVYRDPESGVLRLADGFHRYRAHVAIGAEDIEVDVRDGDYRAAVLHAAQANAKHGLRRTTADKHKAIDRLLHDPEWSKWSDNHIAKQVSVAPQTVRARRDNLEISKCEDVIYLRAGKQQVMRTAGIGRAREPVSTAILFAAAAVAKRPFVPALTCVHFRGGRVLGYDGAVAASSPVALHVECSVNADQVAAALTSSGEPTGVELVRDALVLRWGSRIARVPTSTYPPPSCGEPEGKTYDAPADLLDVLATLQPFISEDASRKWSRGVLLRAGRAYATNDAIIIEREGAVLPVDIGVPAELIELVVKHGEKPKRVQTDGQSVTFHYASGRWVKAKCLFPWRQVENSLPPSDRCVPVPEGFFAALKRLRKGAGAERRVYFLGDGVMSTTPSLEFGACVADTVPGVGAWGCYNIDQLLRLDGVATAFDLGAPDRAPFVGPRLRGVILPMHGEEAPAPLVSEPPPPPPPPPVATPCLDKLAAYLGVEKPPPCPVLQIGEQQAERVLVKLGLS